MTAYGKQLRELRTAAGVSLVALAARLGRSKQQLWQWENGARSMSQPVFLQAKGAVLQMVGERAQSAEDFSRETEAEVAS